MKIIFANNYYYFRGGSERVFFDEMEVLESRGHRVAPFTRRYAKNLPSRFSRFFAPEIEYENVSIFKKFPAGAKLIYSPECGERLGGLIDHFGPDIVHGHNIYGRLTTSIIDEARRRNIPAVITLHDYKLICPSYIMLSGGGLCERCLGNRYYKCLIQRCHKGSLVSSLVYTAESYFNHALKKYGHVRFFISPSEFLLKKHVESGIPEKSLAHIRNFIRPEDFEPAYGPGKHILYAGRLSKEKGVLTLLKAAKKIDIELKIVGDGPLRAEYEGYARDNGIDNVVFEGYKSGEDLKNLFRGASFVVFPSEWYENAPMTIIEAFAYGKPVIGSDIGGIPEMITDGKTGRLFPAGDHQQLREMIIELAESPSKIEEMGKRARRLVEEEYNAQTHYKKLIDVYQRALS